MATIRERDEELEERREATEDRNNWWPLLLIPIAFFLGWGANQAANSATNERAYNNTTQYGVGGGPGTPCANPNSGSSTTDYGINNGGTTGGSSYR